MFSGLKKDPYIPLDFVSKYLNRTVFPLLRGPTIATVNGSCGILEFNTSCPKSIVFFLGGSSMITLSLFIYKMIQFNLIGRDGMKVQRNTAINKNQDELMRLSITPVKPLNVTNEEKIEGETKLQHNAEDAVMKNVRENKVKEVETPNLLANLQKEIFSKFKNLEIQLSDVATKIATPVQPSSEHIMQRIEEPIQAYVPPNEYLIKQLQELNERVKAIEKQEFKAVEVKKIPKRKMNWTTTF